MKLAVCHDLIIALLQMKAFSQLSQVTQEIKYTFSINTQEHQCPPQMSLN